MMPRLGSSKSNRDRDRLADRICKAVRVLTGAATSPWAISFTSFALTALLIRSDILIIV